MRRVLLASTSPRRRELLAAAGIDFELVAPGEEAVTEARSDPGKLALELALAKAQGAEFGGRSGVVLGADTVVELDGEILGKPRDRDDAREMLLRLAERVHGVYTGHALARVDDGVLDARWLVKLASSRVEMRALDERELERYLDRQDWTDKAGGYGIQSDAASFATLVEGELDTVIGLNVRSVVVALDELSDY